MNKKALNLRSLLDQYQANCDRINAIADACETEQRERTEVETNEYNALVRENQLLDMRMRSAANAYGSEEAKVDSDKIIRENMHANRQTEITLLRGKVGSDYFVMVSDAKAGGIVPVKVQDILKPFYEGLIADKVGLPMPTGLAGDYVWPIVEAVEATVLGEGVALSDTELPLDKLTATPERIGVAIPVTNQTIDQTEGVADTIIRDVLPKALAALINKILFSTSAVTGATHLVGPFVGKSAVAMTTADAKKINALKAKILTKTPGDKLAWVMTKATEAALEVTPVNEKGIFKPMAENHMMFGLPIFTTQYIGDGNVGIGDWALQPMGLFGKIRLVIDPVSKARRDAVDFVLNANYGTKCLKPAAFEIATIADLVPTE